MSDDIIDVIEKIIERNEDEQYLVTDDNLNGAKLLKLDLHNLKYIIVEDFLKIYGFR